MILLIRIEPAEQVVKRTILQHDHHDMLDVLHPSCRRRAGRRASQGGSSRRVVSATLKGERRCAHGTQAGFEELSSCEHGSPLKSSCCPSRFNNSFPSGVATMNTG